MPIYNVKPEPDFNTCAVAESPKKKGKRYPTVCLPVSKEILDALSLDGAVTVTLKGTVRGLESRQSSDPSPWGNRDELRMELRVVDAEAGEAVEDEAPEPTMKDAIDAGLGYTKKK